MNDFELRLKELNLRNPSEELREKIFGTYTGQRHTRSVFRYRIALAWAAIFWIVAGVMGFMLGTFTLHWIKSDRTVAKDTVKVQIIYQQTATQPVFDFSEPSNDILPGTLDVSIKSNGEV